MPEDGCIACGGPLRAWRRGRVEDSSRLLLRCTACGTAVMAATAGPVAPGPARVFDAAGFAPATLEAVTVRNVLERVEDPVAALARVHAWLRPGGTLVAVVRDLDSRALRLAGAAWPAPARRCFTARGARILLGRCGFEAVGSGRRRPGSVGLIARRVQ